MGVHGLWRLIDPTGKVVPLETLENKVLAIDLSIWLHQAIKGFRDSKGAPLPNAHLLAIYHRVCKLLYYKIKPVFVFDGGVPILKRETIAKRNQLKTKNIGEVNRIQKQLLNTLLKHSAVNKVLSEKTKNSLGTTTAKISSKTKDDEDDLFKLPPSQLDSVISSSSDEEDLSSTSYSETSTSDMNSPTKHWDIYTINENSKEFRSLPADVRYDILTELKETRKQSSWGKIHEMPTQSDDFSNYQMKRLLKRQSVQASLEAAEKEMGGHSLSLGELETLLTDQGVLSSKEVGSRIAKDETTRVLYIKDVKKAIEEARKENEKKALEQIQEVDEEREEDESTVNKVEDNSGDLKKETKSEIKSENENISEHENKIYIQEDSQNPEFDRDLALAIQLSLQDDQTTLNPPDMVGIKEEEISISINDSSGLKEESIISKGKEINIAEEPSTSQQNDVSSTLHIENPKEIYAPNIFKKPLDMDQVSTNLKPTDSPDSTGSKQATSFKTKLSDFSFLENFSDADFVSDDSEPELEDRDIGNNLLSSAKNYMLEYSGLTPAEVAKIIGKSSGKPTEQKNKSTLSKLSNVINSKSADAVFESERKVPQTNYIINTRKFSSTSDNIIENPSVKLTKLSKENKESIEDVEIMSDSSSDDFLEVPSAEEKIELKNVEPLEVIVEPNAKLDDDNDIFADIFTSKEIQNENKLEKKAGSSLKEKIERNLPSNKNFEGIKQIILRKLDMKESIEESAKDESTKEIQEFKSNSSSQSQEIDTKDSVGMNIEKDACELDFLNKIKEVNESITEDDTKNDENSKSDASENVDIVTEFIKATQDVNDQKDNDNSYEKLSTKQLEAMQANLLAEGRELVSEKATKERLATNLTDQMYQEAQDLLELFGVPYIVAPMEAEAQCAFLEQINLTDGTITDDSDIWLFGGNTVYKNFFNHNKHVLEFQAENIQHHFKLTRYQLILLALLVGSDYTTGIQGVGPVAALEVLANFPPSLKSAQITVPHEHLISGLRNFKTWYCKGKSVAPGKTSLRTKLKNVVFTENFPSIQVVQAYMEPKVDNSEEKFSWAKPDIAGLKYFAKEKFGWTELKSDEILKPIIKRMGEKTIQKSIKDFFKTKHKIVSDNAEEKMSKRVKMAVKKMGKEKEDSSDDEKNKIVKKPTKPRAKKGNIKKDQSKQINEAVASTSQENPEDGSTNSDEILKNIEQELMKLEGLVENSQEQFTEQPLPKRRGRKPAKKEIVSCGDPELDEALRVLKQTRIQSRKKVKQIETEVQKDVDEMVAKKSKIESSENLILMVNKSLHKKEYIPQKERSKADILKSKMKAIEVFRKSKHGPGYVKKHKKVVRAPKDDAGLSESGSDED